MKKLGLFITALLLTFGAMAQDEKGVTLNVTIENVLIEGGTIMAGLHTADSFMKTDGVANTSAAGTRGEVTLTFENVAPGTYAIMVMHDANDNGRMDREANGMPTENYATTGVLNLYGPPVFEDAKFEVGATDQEISIRF